MKSEDYKYIVIGGVPDPVGGVTTFVKRLLFLEKDKIQYILDCYPGVKKSIDSSVDDKIICVKSKMNLIKWFVMRGKSIVRTKFFFNFSSSYSLIIFLFLPKMKSDEWQLMLHHGGLSSSGYLRCILYTYILKKIDIIYVLSESQLSFYKELNVNESKIFQTSSYVPASLGFFENDAELFIKKIKPKYSKIFISSGYPTKIYNHNCNIKYFKSKFMQDYCLVIFLYGPKQGRDEIRRSVKKIDNIFLLEDKNEDYFNFMLRNGDCYLRPTSKDSFGIAVADMISFGNDVIASDVCNRFPGAFIYSHDNCESYHHMLDKYLESNYCYLEKSEFEVSTFKLI